MSRRKRTVKVSAPGGAVETTTLPLAGKRKRRFEIVEIGGSTPTPMDQWATAGRRLLDVDPDRFRRYLMGAQAIVELYESDDPDRTLAAWLPMLGAKGGEA